MYLRTVLSLMLFTLLATTPLAAQEDAENSGTTTREEVDTRLAAVKTELNLDDYKWSQVEMILKSSIRERVAIIQRYGLDGSTDTLEPLEGSEKRAAKRELKESRKDTEKRMKRYLDKAQYKEFKEIQEQTYGTIEEMIDAS